MQQGFHQYWISFITIYMNAYIIEMPSFKYESLVRKVHTEIINFLFNLIR